LNAVFVDSSVWIDHLRGHRTPQSDALRDLLGALRPDADDDDPASIIVGDLVLMEVLRGIDDDAAHARTRAVLLSFRQVSLAGTEAALAAAEHFRALRRLGITVRKTVDCFIATWCIAQKVPLLHADRDFDVFARHRGLRSFT